MKFCSFCLSKFQNESKMDSEDKILKKRYFVRENHPLKNYVIFGKISYV